MIYNTGKTPASTQLLDGSIVQIFNADINNVNLQSNVVFYDAVGNPKYRMTISSDDMSNHHRVACFTRTMPQSTFDNAVRLVVFINDVEITEQHNIPALTLPQLISPNISRLGFDSYQLTWWCNTDSADLWFDPNTTTNRNHDGTYRYMINYVKRFNGTNITQEQPKTKSAKVLCSAAVKWEKLATGLTSNNSTKKESLPQYYPVINNPIVLSFMTNEGYVTDFAAPGNGGDDAYSVTNIHSHTATNDGGFAAAVFMPSAVMKPLNWS